MSREVMQQALEALENIGNWLPTIGQKGLRDYEADAITALREALAQSEEQQSCDKQEPVAWQLTFRDEFNNPRREVLHSKQHLISHVEHNTIKRNLVCSVTPLYTSPPQREWVGLTTDERANILRTYYTDMYDAAEVIEELLKEKNA